MDDPVRAFAAGAISAEVALARLVLRGGDIEAALRNVPALQHVFRAHQAGIGGLREVACAVDHAAMASVEGVAASFDAAVARAPEASVAAYSLGDPATLDRATAELMNWLHDNNLVGLDRDAIDLGCGIGRVTERLARCCRSALGLDVSPRMIEAARRRHPGQAFRVIRGYDLAELAPGSADLIVAVDVFPYLVRAGVADAHVEDAARILRPGGAFTILNLSYDDLDAGRKRARELALTYRFALEVNAASPFSLWDGAAFVFRRLA